MKIRITAHCEVDADERLAGELERYNRQMVRSHLAHRIESHLADGPLLSGRESRIRVIVEIEETEVPA